MPVKGTVGQIFKMFTSLTLTLQLEYQTSVNIQKIGEERCLKIENVKSLSVLQFNVVRQTNLEIWVNEQKVQLMYENAYFSMLVKGDQEIKFTGK